MKKLLLLIIATCTLSVSCRKFEEGGYTTKANKNLLGIWNLEKYIRNSQDETSQLIITNYQETFDGNGMVEREFRNAKGDVIQQEGTYTLSEKKKLIQISGLGSVEMTAASGTVTSSSYDIIKLTDEEFWYRFENGGDTHEFHLKR